MEGTDLKRLTTQLANVLSKRMRNRSELTVEKAIEMTAPKDESDQEARWTRRQTIRVFRSLEQAGYGTFKKGRHPKPSRLIWSDRKRFLEDNGLRQARGTRRRVPNRRGKALHVTSRQDRAQPHPRFENGPILSPSSLILAQLEICKLHVTGNLSFREFKSGVTHIMGLMKQLASSGHITNNPEYIMIAKDIIASCLVDEDADKGRVQ